MAHKRDEFFDELFTVSAPIRTANDFIQPCLLEDPLLVSTTLQFTLNALGIAACPPTGLFHCKSTCHCSAE